MGDLVKKAFDCLDVIGQRRHQIGLLTKDDETDPITLATFYEGTSQRLDRRKTINATTVELDVAGFHAGGKIERQQQVPSARCLKWIAFGDR